MILKAEKSSGGVTSVKVNDDGHLITTSAGSSSTSNTGNILNTVAWDTWNLSETNATTDTVTYEHNSIPVATRVITYKDDTQQKVMSDTTTII